MLVIQYNIMCERGLGRDSMKLKDLDETAEVGGCKPRSNSVKTVFGREWTCKKMTIRNDGLGSNVFA